MDLYKSMLNIRGINIKEETIKLIEETKKELCDLTKTQTCKVYTGYLKNKCIKKGISSRILNTKSLGIPYEHEALLINTNEELFPYILVDLTYIQFPLSQRRILDDKIKSKELEEKGYISVNNEILKYYLMSIACMENSNNINIDNIYIGIGKK